MRPVLCFVLCCIVATNNAYKHKSINLNLETVFEFDGQDPNGDLKIIDGVQNFLKKVKSVITKNQPSRRTMNHEIKFSDFIENALVIIKSYDDKNLVQIFKIMDEEMRKYNKELTANTPMRRFIDTLEGIIETPAAVLRKRIDAALNTITERSDRKKEANLMKFINALYRNSTPKFVSILNNLQLYRYHSKRVNLDLNKIISDGVKDIFFDHLAELEPYLRKELNIQLETYWMQSNKNTKKKGDDTTVSIRDAYKLGKDDGVTSEYVYSKNTNVASNSEAIKSYFKESNIPKKPDKRNQPRNIFMTLYPEEIILNSKKKTKFKATTPNRRIQTLWEVNKYQNSYQRGKKYNSDIRMSEVPLKEIVEVHDAVIQVRGKDESVNKVTTLHNKARLKQKRLNQRLKSLNSELTQLKMTDGSSLEDELTQERTLEQETIERQKDTIHKPEENQSKFSNKEVKHTKKLQDKIIVRDKEMKQSIGSEVSIHTVDVILNNTDEDDFKLTKDKMQEALDNEHAEIKQNFHKSYVKSASDFKHKNQEEEGKKNVHKLKNHHKKIYTRQTTGFHKPQTYFENKNISKRKESIKKDFSMSTIDDEDYKQIHRTDENHSKIKVSNERNTNQNNQENEQINRSKAVKRQKNTMRLQEIQKYGNKLRHERNYQMYNAKKSRPTPSGKKTMKNTKHNKVFDPKRIKEKSYYKNKPRYEKLKEDEYYLQPKNIETPKDGFRMKITDNLENNLNQLKTELNNDGTGHIRKKIRITKATKKVNNKMSLNKGRISYAEAQKIKKRLHEAEKYVDMIRSALSDENDNLSRWNEREADEEREKKKKKLREQKDSMRNANLTNGYRNTVNQRSDTIIYSHQEDLTEEYGDKVEVINNKKKKQSLLTTKQLHMKKLEPTQKQHFSNHDSPDDSKSETWTKTFYRRSKNRRTSPDSDGLSIDSFEEEKASPSTTKTRKSIEERKSKLNITRSDEVTTKMNSGEELEDITEKNENTTSNTMASILSKVVTSEQKKTTTVMPTTTPDIQKSVAIIFDPEITMFEEPVTTEALSFISTAPNASATTKLITSATIPRTLSTTKLPIVVTTKVTSMPTKATPSKTASLTSTTQKLTRTLKINDTRKSYSSTNGNIVEDVTDFAKRNKKDELIETHAANNNETSFDGLISLTSKNEGRREEKLIEYTRSIPSTRTSKVVHNIVNLTTIDPHVIHKFINGTEGFPEDERKSRLMKEKMRRDMGMLFANNSPAFNLSYDDPLLGDDLFKDDLDLGLKFD